MPDRPTPPTPDPDDARPPEDEPAELDAFDLLLAVLRATGLLPTDAETDAGDIPERLGEFRILRQLGFGGMGVVYLAEQEPLGRFVALKLMRPGQIHFHLLPGVGAHRGL